MPCIYILKSAVSKRIYTGSSREDEPSERVVAHNAGKTRSIRFGRPWKLVYTEKYDAYVKARKRELFLKSGRGREIVKQIVSQQSGGVAELGLLHRS